MTKRAILYARVSGDDRKYATSGIDGQLKDCRKYARENGYEIVGEYHEQRDKQTSGADWLPELENVIKLAHQDGFDVLVVREIDRLARNRFKQMSVEIDLASCGVQVEYVKGQFEDSAEGRLLKGLMSEFAEFEREKIKERMIRGTLRSIGKGNIKVSNQPPYGYSVLTKDGRRTLVINELEAEVIRLIFDLYVNQHYTIYAIAVYLDKRNIAKPASSKKGWSHGTIRNILKNETYVGRWYYGKTKTIKNPKTGKRKRVSCPKKDWLLVSVPAIVNEEVFKAAQRLREANKSRGKQRKNVYALGGMLTCRRCNNGMSGITKDEKHRYYVCNIRHGKGRYTSAGPCDSPYYNMWEVDATVWQWVKAIFLSPERLKRELENYQQGQMVESQSLLNILKSSEKKLSELLEERERLIKAYTAGVLTLDEIAIQKTDLDKRISDLRQAISEIKAELTPKLLSQENIQSIEAMAAQVGEGADLTDNDPKTQREIYRLLNLRVTLDEVDGQRWADVTCILGEKNMAVAYTATNWCGIFRPLIPLT